MNFIKIKIKKILKWTSIVLGSLIFCGFLFYVGTAAWVRYSQSQEERSNFDCKITGKERGITNCDKRSAFSYLSDSSAEFSSPQQLNAIYIPFTDQETITLKLNENLKANFDFWIVYDNYGIRELQPIAGEAISNVNPEVEARLLSKKANNNFWCEKSEKHQKITINTKGPFITYKMFGPMGTKFDEFLNQGFNPKGILIWIATSKPNEVIELEIE